VFENRFIHHYLSRVMLLFYRKINYKKEKSLLLPPYSADLRLGFVLKPKEQDHATLL
jgi:hypothetical protein